MENGEVTGGGLNFSLASWLVQNGAAENKVPAVRRVGLPHDGLQSHGFESGNGQVLVRLKSPQSYHEAVVMNGADMNGNGHGGFGQFGNLNALSLMQQQQQQQQQPGFMMLQNYQIPMHTNTQVLPSFGPLANATASMMNSYEPQYYVQMPNGTLEATTSLAIQQQQQQQQQQQLHQQQTPHFMMIPNATQMQTVQCAGLPITSATGVSPIGFQQTLVGANPVVYDHLGTVPQGQADESSSCGKSSFDGSSYSGGTSHSHNGNGHGEPEDANGNPSLKKKSSKYRGVSWHKRDKSWVARICHKGKTKHIGIYSSEERAALAFDLRSLELGNNERLNFPDALERDLMIAKFAKKDTNSRDVIILPAKENGKPKTKRKRGTTSCSSSSDEDEEPEEDIEEQQRATKTSCVR